MKNLNRFNSHDANDDIAATFETMAESAHAFAVGKAAKPAKRDAWKGHNRRNERRAAIAAKHAYFDHAATSFDVDE